MPTRDLDCWNCGELAPEVPLPVGRGEDCPACQASLRCCRGCGFYDPHAGNSCRESMAEQVADREGPNTCDYFRPVERRENLHESGEAAKARASLDAVFGAGETAGDKGALAKEAAEFKQKERSEAEAARGKLESLFGKKER